MGEVAVQGGEHVGEIPGEVGDYREVRKCGCVGRACDWPRWRGVLTNGEPTVRATQVDVALGDGGHA